MKFKLPNFFKKPEIISPFNHIYTDKEGNKWYALKNPANISAERALAAWAFMEDSKYGLTRENMQAITTKMNEAINRNDMATVAKLTGLIESCMELYTSEQILLNLASVYAFIGDEKNEGVVDYINEKKRKIWSEDVACRSFFLQFAYRYTHRYSEQPELNVLTYLERVRPIINDLNRILTTQKSQRKG